MPKVAFRNAQFGKKGIEGTKPTDMRTKMHRQRDAFQNTRSKLCVPKKHETNNDNSPHWKLYVAPCLYKINLKKDNKREDRQIKLTSRKTIRERTDKYC